MERHDYSAKDPSQGGQIFLWAIFGLCVGACVILLTQSMVDVYQRRMAAQLAADSGAAATGAMMARGLNELAWIQWMQSILVGILVLYSLYRWVLTLAILIATALSAIPQLVPFTTQELTNLIPLETRVLIRYPQIKASIDGAFDALERSKPDVLRAFEVLALEEATRSNVEWQKVPQSTVDLNGAENSLFLADDKSLKPGLPVGPTEKTNAWCGPVELGALGAADEGWALRMISDLTVPTDALELLRQGHSKFEEKNEGPGSPGLDQTLWIPYLGRSISSRSVLATGLATAPQVVVGLLGLMEGRSPCENMLLYNPSLLSPPWQMEETWQNSLTYTFGARMPYPPSPYGVAYESEAIKSLGGMIALSRFEVYHPYYDAGDTPDLVSPQWRVRRLPDPLNSFDSFWDLVGGEDERSR